MRRLGLSVGLLAALLLMSSCSSLLSFDVDSTGTATIQHGPPGAGLIGGALPGFNGFDNFNVSQTQAFKNNNTNKDHISSCRLTRLRLTVTAPSASPGNDLSFLTSIEFYISAPPNLPEQRIAHSTTLPAGQSVVDLAIDDTDIASYAKADSFSIKTTATGHAPAQDTTVRADLTLNIHASLL
jgi:hypothetical protein